jgi:hypothetical protein
MKNSKNGMKCMKHTIKEGSLLKSEFENYDDR